MAAMQAGVRGGRIRAFRSEGAEEQVMRRQVALSVLFSTRQEIERALRDARRAGRAGARHYDPARHAALIRLWKLAGRGEGNAAMAGRGAGGGVVRLPAPLPQPVAQATGFPAQGSSRAADTTSPDMI